MIDARIGNVSEVLMPGGRHGKRLNIPSSVLQGKKVSITYFDDDGEQRGTLIMKATPQKIAQLEAEAKLRGQYIVVKPHSK